ncbi:astacin-like metalloprotease toxin 5 isoform X1 [Dermacentor andersoni]|uniref:astacin-like metalloprotease toxin 5 isoform X1 n=1 Tax=Dermacentor andersoni TaxID=34620 RepID=UPI00215523CA|nr:astacin-like metalloprotease toxin 5 [Dermacentor andersoni]
MGFAPTTYIAALLLTSVVQTTLAAPAWPHPGNQALESTGLFEGDILLPGNNSEDRTAVTNDLLLWPEGIIPFVVESSLGRYTEMIRQAIDEIEGKTCLRFVPRTTQRDYITIYRGSGCYSGIGRLGRSQPVSLGFGCLYKGTMVHELLHAAGFFHEHSRSDRDIYIDVFTENAKEGTQKQFEKLESWQNRLLTPFDVNSVMLYGSYAFAKAPDLVTMLAKDGGYLTEVYDKPGMSADDVVRVKKLYKCPE